MKKLMADTQKRVTNKLEQVRLPRPMTAVSETVPFVYSALIAR